MDDPFYDALAELVVLYSALLSERLSLPLGAVMVTIDTPEDETGFGLDAQTIFINASIKHYEAKHPEAFRDELLSTSTLVQMPGCCGMCVSTGASVHSDYRGYGIGTIMAELRCKIAMVYGYSAMICTDVVTNLAQQRVLDKVGYERVFGFLNQRTGNQLSVHIKDLNHGREKT